MNTLAKYLFVLYVATAIAASAFFATALRTAIFLSTTATVSAIALALLLWTVIRDFDETLGVIALFCWMVTGAVNAIQTAAMRLLLSFADAASKFAGADALLSHAHAWSVGVTTVVSMAGAVIYGFIATRPAIRTRPNSAGSTSAPRARATVALNAGPRLESFS
jgi:hypothetical protein